MVKIRYNDLLRGSDLGPAPVVVFATVVIVVVVVSFDEDVTIGTVVVVVVAKVVGIGGINVVTGKKWMYVGKSRNE